MTQPDPNPRAVLAALGVAGIAAVRPLRGGSDTAIWRVEAGDDRFALRLFRPGQDQTSARELAAMDAARRGGIPAPKVEAHGNWEGRPAMLLSWCRGQTIAAALRAQPWRAWALGSLFGRTHAALHAVPAPLGWSDSWLDVIELTEATKARLTSLGGDSHRLLHLDYHPLNVLTDGRAITGVIDWTNARGGDPRADIARTTTILRLDAGPRPPSPAVRAVLAIFEAGWRHGYRRAGGPLHDPKPFYAWAGAVMVRDLAEKRDAAFLERVRRWASDCGRMAGTTPTAVG